LLKGHAANGKAGVNLWNWEPGSEALLQQRRRQVVRPKSRERLAALRVPEEAAAWDAQLRL
jgi:hypothetical protein